MSSSADPERAVEVRGYVGTRADFGTEESLGLGRLGAKMVEV